MAPRKKAEEKTSGNEATDMILHYLRKQNRPYSVIDVCANLHNKVTKTVAAKILKELHEQKQIEGRSAGKQMVYHALQNPDDAVTPEQLAAADAQTADLRTQTATLQATAKSLRSSLAALNSTLSTADLVRSVQVLDAEKTEIEARLDSLRAGRAKKVTPQERAEGERMWKVCGAAKMRRERIAREMWQMIEDGVPDVDKRVELREAMGLDE